MKNRIRKFSNKTLSGSIITKAKEQLKEMLEKFKK
ncbi:predicted protein [Enterococcus faecalis T8]|nr:predicted protein [Enterococcus faecalis T8]